MRIWMKIAASDAIRACESRSGWIAVDLTSADLSAMSNEEREFLGTVLFAGQVWEPAYSETNVLIGAVKPTRGELRRVLRDAVAKNKEPQK